jgi:hypothetical protein
VIERALRVLGGEHRLLVLARALTAVTANSVRCPSVVVSDAAGRTAS